MRRESNTLNEELSVSRPRSVPRTRAANPQSSATATSLLTPRCSIVTP